MRLLPLLFLAGVLPGCATPGEGTPRGMSMSAAVGRAGAPCVPDRQARRPGVIAPAPAVPHPAKDRSDAACAGRDGRAVTAVLAPKPAGTPSGHVVEAGPIAAGAGEPISRPPSRVQGRAAPAIARIADSAPSPVPDDDAPFITMVPNPFRSGTAAPEPARGAPHPASRAAL